MQGKVMSSSRIREFEGELEEYTINKHIINLLSNMGFIIKEHESTNGMRGGKRTSLVKQTHKHLLMVNFDYRRRIILSPKEVQDKMVREDPDLLRQMQPDSFGTFLRKNGLVPPDFNLPENDEDNMR